MIWDEIQSTFGPEEIEQAAAEAAAAEVGPASLTLLADTLKQRGRICLGGSASCD